nr:hypothetical protein [Russula griseocarnosa]
MNLQKYSKAELISKFKKLDAKLDSNLNNETFSSKVVKLILALKSALIKLTLITLIVKIFKKYTFISKILRFSNWVIVSIFGISLIDNFNLFGWINEIKVIFSTIIKYITTTSFYSYVASFTWFRTNEEPKIHKTTRSKSPGIYSQSEFNEAKITKSNNDSKILKRLNNEGSSHSENPDRTKYYILLLLLALACIAWYNYGGDITPPGIGILWSWINGIKNKNTINELKSTSTSFKTAKDNIYDTYTDAKDFLRKKENNIFDSESKTMLKDIDAFNIDKYDDTMNLFE